MLLVGVCAVLGAPLLALRLLRSREAEAAAKEDAGRAARKAAAEGAAAGGPAPTQDQFAPVAGP
ncbi:hypothetical protein [Streptomyces sp. WAC06614]|uniref:hypothetical protein n=1 Tax=Streptomyces sp. WAC06614 TaxID=2487416 RepID=UPI000F79E8F7|nr:hypothetical protein [Streptomyces sp. WAC06614]RSS84140.1 hypothetical protein EF918_01360 [Streptomyces sp. WAC06614]